MSAVQHALFPESVGRRPAETPRAAAMDIAEDLADAQIAISEAAGMGTVSGGDLCLEIERVLSEMNRRAEADLEALRRLHAKIEGVPLEKLDAKIAARKAEEAKHLEELKRSRPAPPARPSKRSKAKAATPDPIAPPTTKLTARQQELLAGFIVEGNVARFASTERISDWPAVKVVFLALGAKWRTGKPGGFVFRDEDDGAEKVRLALESGEIFDPKAAGFFPTPARVASDLALSIHPGMRVLEPSAGRGAIAEAAKLHGGEVTCFELMPDNAAELRRLGFEVVEGDFLAAEPRPEFDAVVMNPPFADQLAHIRRAFEWVKPGGVLHSVASAGIQYRQDAAHVEFRAWAESLSGVITPLPDGSFLSSGTGVRTCTVLIGRPK